MVKVWGAEVSLPPPAVPPLSCATRVIVDVPVALAVGVYVSVPVGDTAGAVLKIAGLLLPMTRNVTAWPLSDCGPGLMPVAHATACRPASSRVLWFPPPVNDGAWFGPDKTESVIGAEPEQPLASFTATVK